jgi:FkbM family methyltransferase
MFGYRTLKRFVPAPILIREMAWRYWRSGEREVRILKRLIRPGSNSVDVGAASGLYSYHLSRLCERVFAYEPNPEWVRWLVRAAPGNVSVFNVALSNHKGTAVLSIPPPSLESLKGDLTLRCLEAASIEKQFDGVPCDRIPVVTQRLDEDNLQNIGFIKIDVEGHEMAVLEGAEETLRRCRPVVLMEIGQHHIKWDIREEFAAIEAKGYEGCFFLEGRFHPLRDFISDKHQPEVDFELRPACYVSNFIFRPSDASSR